MYPLSGFKVIQANCTVIFIIDFLLSRACMRKPLNWIFLSYQGIVFHYPCKKIDETRLIIWKEQCQQEGMQSNRQKVAACLFYNHISYQADTDNCCDLLGNSSARLSQNLNPLRHCSKATALL